MSTLLNLQITAFENGGVIPEHFATKAAGGQNVSFGVKWQPLPAAQSYALLLDDKHPVANQWVHWLVVDVANTVTEIVEGASGRSMPALSRELVNGWGELGYGGPQPPVGSGDHEYVLTLYALEVPKIDVSENASRSDFLKAIEPYVITSESYSGFYRR